MSKESDFQQSLEGWQKKELTDINTIFEAISEAGFGMTVKIKPRAFRKENIVTFCPPEMEKIGERQPDGSMIFTLPTRKEIFEGTKTLSIHTIKMGLPYIVIYGAGCAYEAYFDPSDIESIKVRPSFAEASEG